MPSTKTIKAAIAGAAGYTGGELIRILLRHPQVEMTALLTTRLHGQPVASVHRDLYGDCDLRFTDTPGEPDVLFLCLGHGLSREFLTNTPVPDSCKIIDLGSDFRVANTFGARPFVYGLPELFRDAIGRAAGIANPGCFATAILLALAPLAASRRLAADVHIHAITGATGAGRHPGETTHFSARAANLSVYKPFVHQHLEEIKKTLGALSRSPVPEIAMIPVRGDFTRGLFASILTKLPDETDGADVREQYRAFYAASPFVHLSDETVSLKEVVNTNKALLNVDYHRPYLHITSVIDNLLKGASGQAVQNMNLLFGLTEDCGLRLKGSAF
ncbi:MAG: N-acetyl-gamma-glutamyl-phosphate reductase [Prevotellaceae bacterium]|jgi:N-acetyl-gamma-glutamyl-phosphate reductase|nr:N-acetyl-gamma-glutamyl-phosphate reductase [Prevotellaceae bacterium]